MQFDQVAFGNSWKSRSTGDNIHACVCLDMYFFKEDKREIKQKHMLWDRRHLVYLDSDPDGEVDGEVVYAANTWWWSKSLDGWQS